MNELSFHIGGTHKLSFRDDGFISMENKNELGEASYCYLEEKDFDKFNEFLSKVKNLMK